MSESGSNQCPSVSFNLSTVKVGLVKNGWTGKTPVLTKKVVATVSPKKKADKATFSMSNTTRASFSEDNRKEVGDSIVITFIITGLDPTPPDKKTGDCNFEAKCSKKTLASCTVLVVVPSTQTHSAAAPTIANSSTNQAGPPPSTTIYSETTGIVTITIKDQLDSLLDSMYDLGAVEEIFSNVTQNGYSYGAPVQVWTTINIPKGDTLSAGVKLDETGFGLPLSVTPQLTPAQAASWAAGTLNVAGIDNTFQGKAGGWVATQAIRVVGWDVTPSYSRNQQQTGGTYNPVPYTITDTAQP